MYMDQVYQVRAIMEATGVVKDAPLIRELLDEARATRRQTAVRITLANVRGGTSVKGERRNRSGAFRTLTISEGWVIPTNYQTPFLRQR